MPGPTAEHNLEGDPADAGGLGDPGHRCVGAAREADQCGVGTAGRRTGITVVDPVCGMTITPGTAAEHRGGPEGTVCFCSAHCASAYHAPKAPASHRCRVR
ncbi:hypothetical protein GCM10010193_06760 [Kitasatospora atroaurantiaca]|uniref:YHS domain-containing protein n=1 Tax=Kitasatospora atroaurantiaca TaxID=285545 RepID=A0A561EJ46_9ACTN|nr:YHS domain-containing protein [Kitasatospora atroaurantiaca]